MNLDSHQERIDGASVAEADQRTATRFAQELNLERSPLVNVPLSAHMSFRATGIDSALGSKANIEITDKEAELLRDPDSELSLSKALMPFAVMAGAGLLTGGSYYLLTAASRRAARMDVLARTAHEARSEFRDAINYLASATGKPADIVANSNGLLNGKMQRHLGTDIGFGVGDAGKWLVRQKDGGILVKSDFGDPYVRFFAGGAFESGSNYKMDMGNFFISPRRSLHVTTDGSTIYWERGILGRLDFKPSSVAMNEPWAQSVQSMIEKSESQILKNLMLTQHQRGMNLNAGLARELRGANIKEAFAQVPKDAQPFGVGREAMVFRKLDGDVLRLTRNPFKRPPELKDFLLQAKDTQKGAGWQLETLPYMDRLVLRKSALQELDQGLEKLGYRISDGHIGNLRMYGDKALIIDPGAVEKAAPMLSFWEAAKRKFRRDLQILKEEFRRN